VRELIELEHPDVSRTCWAPRSALGQMDPGWTPVREPQTVTEAPSAATADETQESEND
jgi:hypothetical protein